MKPLTTGDPAPTTSSGVLAPADDEDTERIARAVSARLAKQPTPDAEDLTIGRYIQAELRAHGGMGRIFVAYDPVLDRPVALKALPVGLSPREQAARVPRTEGKSLASIDHRNVVRVFEMIEHRGLDCLVLEHVEGMHLGKWLQSADVRDWRSILQKFLLAGEGLAAVHQAGLIHRDFKPENVIVGGEGAVKLVDFGLATPVGALRPGDREICAGTPRYMAPEQIQCHHIDARTDQYSFCVALYEALFGVHPYLSPALERSEDMREAPAQPQQDLTSRTALLGDILRAQLQHPKRNTSGLPATLYQALQRGISPRPDERFPSMAALLAQLERDPRRTRRRYFQAMAAAASLVVLSAASYHYGRGELCLTEETLTEAVWNGRREAISAKLQPLAPASLLRLDRMAAALAGAQRKACEARVGGERSDIDIAREVCLQARDDELSAVLARLEHGDDKDIVGIVEHLGELPSVHTCDAVEPLRLICDGPLPLTIAAARGALLAGDFTGAQDLVNTALRADSNQSPGAQALAHALLGRIALQQDDWDRALHELTTAQRIAEQNGCTSVKPELYPWLTKLAAFDERIPLARGEDYSTAEAWSVPASDTAGRALQRNNHGLLIERRGHDLPHAERLFREAIALRHGELDLSDAQADSYLNLASTLHSQGKIDASAAALNDAEFRRAQVFGADSPLLYKELANRARREVERGRADAAVELYRRAIKLAAAALGDDVPILGDLNIGLTQAYERRGDLEDALATAQKAEQLYAPLPAQDLRRSEAQEAIAQVLIATGRDSDAIPWLKRANTQLQAHPDTPKKRRAALESRWAEALNGLKRHPEAEQHARSALAWLDRDRAPAEALLRAYANLSLGEALLYQQLLQPAIGPFTRARAIWRATADNPERLGWAAWGLAQSLCDAPERRSEAISAAKEALRALSLIDPEQCGYIEEWLAAPCDPAAPDPSPP